MEEQKTETTFLSESGVRVTNTRLIVPTQTFAMSGITSVASFVEKPKRFWPILFLALGGLSLTGGRDYLVLAIPLLAIGGIWFAKQKTKFSVHLSTASGEASALTSEDKQWIDKVVLAINNSIIHRG